MHSARVWLRHTLLFSLLVLLVISVSACDDETITNNLTNDVTSADLVLETATETPTQIAISTSVPTSTRVPTAISGWYPHPGLYKPNPTRTPIPPYSITLDQPLAFDFYDEQHGWVVVDNGTLNTSDGGLSWSPKKETYILKATSDGGQNWSSIYSSTINIQSVSLGSPIDGWFVMSDTLGITHDAGATWQTSDAFPNSNSLAIDFPDSMNGWAWWWVFDDSKGYLQNKPGLSHTTDGGRTWTQDKYPCTPYYAHSFIFIDASLGWVLCTDDWVTHSSWKALFRTDDAGATWRLINDSSRSPNELSLRVFPKDFSFADDKNGLIVFKAAPYISVIRTTDGGLTWSAEQNMSSGDWQLQMISPTIIYGIYGGPRIVNGVPVTANGEPYSQTGLVKSNRDTQTSMQVYPRTLTP